MKYTESAIPDAWLLELEPIEDERGFFSRSFCRDEFQSRGLNPMVAQCNVSFNRKKGTLRGMHFQTAPYQEAKLVRCTRGSIFDVILDLRPDSPAFKSWQSFELTAENRLALYIPEGVAHGFQCLIDNCEVFYQMAEIYHPECSSGVRFNDPAFSIHWPLSGPIISDRDLSYPLFSG